jgi:hypothetical protein
MFFSQNWPSPFFFSAAINQHKSFAKLALQARSCILHLHSTNPTLSVHPFHAVNNHAKSYNTTAPAILFAHKLSQYAAYSIRRSFFKTGPHLSSFQRQPGNTKILQSSPFKPDHASCICLQLTPPSLFTLLMMSITTPSLTRQWPLLLMMSMISPPFEPSSPAALPPTHSLLYAANAKSTFQGKTTNTYCSKKMSPELQSVFSACQKALTLE